MSEKTIKRPVTSIRSMGRISTPDYVHAEITVASKEHLLTSMYTGASFDNLKFIYCAGRDVLQRAVDSFINEQDKLLGITTPRSITVCSEVLNFAELTDEELRLLKTEDQYRKHIKKFCKRQNLSGVKKPEWLSDETDGTPYCSNRRSERTLYDYNRRLFVPRLEGAIGELEEKLNTEDLWRLLDIRHDIASAFISSYEGYVRNCVKISDYFG